MNDTTRLDRAEQEIDRLQNIARTQQKQVERLLEARDIEKHRADTLRQENASLAARIVQLQGFVGPPTSWGSALRDLLAPTVTLLEKIRVNNAAWGEHCTQELDRLTQLIRP